MKRLYHIANRFCMLTNNNNDGHFTLDFHVSWSLDSTCNKSCYTPTLTMVRVNTLHPSTYLAVHVRHPSWLECQRRGGFQESFQAAGSLWRFVVLVQKLFGKARRGKKRLIELIFPFFIHFNEVDSTHTQSRAEAPNQDKGKSRLPHTIPLQHRGWYGGTHQSGCGGAL